MLLSRIWLYFYDLPLDVLRNILTITSTQYELSQMIPASKGHKNFTFEPFKNLRAIFCKSHPTCDLRVFRISSYFNQLKIKVILEYGRNFGFIKHFVEFLGGSRDKGVFQEMQSVSPSYILKATSALLELFVRVQVTST